MVNFLLVVFCRFLRYNINRIEGVYMRKLNNKGFAISAILYTLLILTVLLMFLVVSVMSNRRATLNRLSDKAKEDVGKQEEVIEPPAPLTLFEVIAGKSKGNDSTINYKQYSSATNGEGVYVITKTAGNSYPIYFYRGNVKDNYIVFAEHCWQIVRTLNNGGIKLIYVNSGTTCKYDKNSVINPGTTNKENYSTTAVNGHTYSSSNVKKVVDNWYTNNIANKADAVHVNNTIWCNETVTTTQAATRTPEVNTCSRTVTAKAALPTYDEVVLAGGVYNTSGVHRNYYLYIEQNHDVPSSQLDNITAVTMTVAKASSSTSTASQVYYIGSNGQLDAYNVKYGYNIRPMIAIAPGAMYASGDGTQANPYRVSW